MEIWKDIPNYEGYYQVSNLGQIKSLSRKLRFVSKSDNESFRICKERLLKQTPTQNGYLAVSLNKHGVRELFKIHVLVAIGFLNHKPNGYKLIVDHIDNDKLNNNVNNLQLITQRENSNRTPRGKSKYAGVTWRKNRSFWVSNIFVNGKKIYLGSFQTELEASEAYQNKIKQINCD